MKKDFDKYFKPPLTKKQSDATIRLFSERRLSLTHRLLAGIAASEAKLDRKYLAGFIRWSLAAGIDYSQIYEVILQGYLFAGYPAALESMFVLADIITGFQEVAGPRNTPDSLDWNYDEFNARGQKTAKLIYRDKLAPVQNNIKRLSPDLAKSMIVEGYGRIISRPGLDLITRELCIVSMLAASEMPRQLYSHIKGAINVGAKPYQVKYVIDQTILVSGRASVESALSVMEKSLGKADFPK